MYPPTGIDQNPKRLTLDRRMDVSRRQRRFIVHRGRGTNDDRLRFGAQFMAIRACPRPGDPLRRTVRRTCAAIDGHGGLGQTIGPSRLSLMQIGRKRTSGVFGARSDRDVYSSGT